MREQAGWVAVGYLIVGVVALGVLFALNEIRFQPRATDPRLILLGEVLGKVQDQAARFVVTFNVGFFVFTLSLSLRDTGAQMQALMWLRAFPSLGFAFVQIASLIRWRSYLLKEIG